jgi:hypothetical protein
MVSNGYTNGVPNGVVPEPVALAERSCIAYMGTLVRNGELVDLRGRYFDMRTECWTKAGVRALLSLLAHKQSLE